MCSTFLPAEELEGYEEWTDGESARHPSVVAVVVVEEGKTRRPWLQSSSVFFYTGKISLFRFSPFSPLVPRLLYRVSVPPFLALTTLHLRRIIIPETAATISL